MLEFKIGRARKQRRIIIFCLGMRVTIERSAESVQLLGFFSTTLGVAFGELVGSNWPCAICDMPHGRWDLDVAIDKGGQL
jgi:hypothetical protein